MTNLLFLGSAAAVLLGTLWPTFTEMVRGVATSLGPENYNRFMGPLGLLLVLLIGVCPLIDWRKISPERLLQKPVGPTGGGRCHGRPLAPARLS